MAYKTFAQIKQKVERELDLEAEDIVQPEEFQEYVNDGIDEAEAEIHKLGLEDEYFLTKAFLALNTGVGEYSLPANIYANKIRKVIYKSGSQVYEIKRLRGKKKFEVIADIELYGNTLDYYQYLLTNPDADGGVVFNLYPPSRETSTQNANIWYIRCANRWVDLVVDTTLCDLPAFALNFLYAYVQWRCFDKEQHPGAGEKKAYKEEAKRLMVETLTNMVPDEESGIEMDLSSYDDLA